MEHTPLTNLAGAFIDAYGLSRPQWKLIAKEIFRDPSPQVRHDRWCAAQREWLDKLCAEMGPPYRVSESEKFLILHPHRGDADWMCEFAEEARALVGGLLDAAISPDVIGKTAVLILAGEARYRQYVRYYTRDGQPVRNSVACCVFDGDTHIVLAGLSHFRQAVVHELVHARLAHLPLPAWVHEGIAQHVERLLVVRSKVQAPEFRRDQQRGQWRLKGIQPFWSGEAFRARRGDREFLAYVLAERVATDMIRTGDRDRFTRFLRDANRADAGDQACRTHYGVGLADKLQDLLGQGDWTPRPETWQ